MDIKEQIDNLTELEAKAALYKCITVMSEKIGCEDCDNLYAKIERGRVVRCDGQCQQYWLEESLKEARK